MKMKFANLRIKSITLTQNSRITSVMIPILTSLVFDGAKCSLRIAVIHFYFKLSSFGNPQILTFLDKFLYDSVRNTSKTSAKLAKLKFSAMTIESTINRML